ncbi:hypothetical protein A2334_00810 [Candidatus Roizmanbacteria bacterium RIFOXYB2_FULL_38_10]|uniref:Uncharacterized protein n=1 Tax=Candidatus Roizmanbacteria bacterium RIFOXYD1_FULL_38_12 TaxID=1802093 RepID=A0A1F7L1K6_9BACT|nr:MAG: hypothetical protein A3K47_04105 [Candidatus Roizmanbacteria bacterium RIFOXYA2_FULL_38_14]OGK63941.1 MAG: hypothetical protein A3K27_04105 [Candidatus Roizmanbacteria bacterium RIFOXYA1_FULL_37_12]OGK65787.1 MAG: hypothetical protein A3K38_04105 [Candidatus Roizmanbacteria bacterium RIFOXYB1_FULL_40_23]OGK68895.1 MAG: hypothetical protein A2334_00810 [Candidatus Roizmanbacteria bacterium RIFOXYB2_FULL_38_10]OGK70192.1 MAG: hypothetical protein A3K21_04110 [Candidatus Roizmanbacteria ba
MDVILKDLQKKAYQLLLEAMTSALKKGEMTVDDSEVSSRKIVRNLDGIESYTELLLFLQSLANTYPAYKGVYVSFKQEEAAQKDKKKMEALQARLRQFASI